MSAPPATPPVKTQPPSDPATSPFLYETNGKSFDPAAILAATNQPITEEPGTKLSSFKVSEALHRGQGNNARIALSRDGKRVLVHAKSYEVYDAETGKLVSKPPVKPLPGSVERIAISTNGRLVACSVGKLFVTVNADTGEEVARADFATPLAHLSFSDEKVCWAIDDKTIVHNFRFYEGKSDSFDTGPARGRKGKIAVGANGNRFIAAPEEAPWAYLFIEKGVLSGVDDPSIRRPLRLGSLAVSDRFVAHTDVGLGKVTVHLVTLKLPQVEFRQLDSQPLRAAGSMDALAISSDEKWLLHTSHDYAEVRSLDHSMFPAVHKVKLGHGFQTGSADAMRVAGIMFGDVVVYQLPPPNPLSPPTAFVSLLHRLLNAKQFEKLEAIAALIAEDGDEFPWAPDQEKYNGMVQLLGTTASPDLRPQDRDALVDEWFQQRPDSHLARVLLAQRALDDAWQARGEGFASEVTPEGRRKFAEGVEAAHQVLKPLLQDEKAPLDVYSFLFEIAKAQSWSVEECEPHIERLLKRNPRYLKPHVVMAEKLMPRWGGEPGANARYVTRVADAIGGPDGDVAYARLATKIALYEDGVDFFIVGGFDYKRMIRGWKIVQAQMAKPDFGLIGELLVAARNGDQQRVAEIRKRTFQEQLQYVPGILPNQLMYNQLLMSRPQ